VKVAAVLGALALASSLPAFAQTVPNEKAELPFWPYGVDLGEPAVKAGGAKGGAAIMAWVPEKAGRIRAVLLIVNNAASKHFGEHPALREVAARREMGVVYLRSSNPEAAIGNDPKSTMLSDILGAVADATKIPEFRHAPWITFGQSSRGKFPFTIAWAFPERTIATISHHAETPTWPAAPWAKLDQETVLHASMNGEVEWGGTWHRHVRPSLLNYRARTAWLPHQVVAYDVGHQNEVDLGTGGGPAYGQQFPGVVTIAKIWDYLAVYVDKALELRLPKDGYPTQGPLKLRAVDPNSGLLIHPFAIEALFELPPFPLRETQAGYVVDPSTEKPQTFVAIAPDRAYQPPEGVPVVPLAVGRGLPKWLVTRPLPFAMKTDPMRSLGDLQSLRPKPGDTVRIDGQETAFEPAQPRFIAADGKLNLDRMVRGAKATFLAFAVVEAPEKTAVTINVPFTASGRVQAVIAGVKVEHKQIVELDKGLYPLLIVARLQQEWASLTAGFLPATEQQIAEAKKRTEELKDVASPDGGELPVVKLTRAEMIRKASEAPEAERRRMFWIADEEQAEAWLKLHTIHRSQR
jgi:hypothetical protein